MTSEYDSWKTRTPDEECGPERDDEVETDAAEQLAEEVERVGMQFGKAASREVLRDVRRTDAWLCSEEQWQGLEQVAVAAFTAALHDGLGGGR